MPIQVNLDRQMFEKKVSLTELAGRVDLKDNAFWEAIAVGTPAFQYHGLQEMNFW